MLKEYLVVAQEALEAKKEMYMIKQQRLELAQQEMLLFRELSEDNRSLTSSKHFPSKKYARSTHLIITVYEHERSNQSKRSINRPQLTWNG